jgi:energy-coupling factor transport system permease protein
MAVGGMFVVMLLWFMTYSQVLTADKFLSLFSRLIPSLALLLTMVLRLIPNLIRKANQILVSRRSIGKGVPEAASKKQRMKDGMNLVSALTDWLLEGSIITADSMRSRGYGTARRTSFQIYRFTARDGVLVGILLSLAAAVILLGGFEASYTPTWAMQSPGWGLLFYGAYLFVPMILQGKEELQWHISLSRI